ncbi:hypothetical protein EZS27_004163 [termite gut metagenome]|uniref:Bro-N domain-containing protein n=1 Tax=termite gut metagenome TaxID=433724 RepID=A0A5J4SQX2_9ZZZZ
MQKISYSILPDGNINVQVQLEDAILWLTQKRMAELFGIEVSKYVIRISLH